MNKLFKKLSVICLGALLSIGVGSTLAFTSIDRDPVEANASVGQVVYTGDFSNSEGATESYSKVKVTLSGQEWDASSAYKSGTEFRLGSKKNVSKPSVFGKGNGSSIAMTWDIENFKSIKFNYAGKFGTVSEISIYKSVNSGTSWTSVASTTTVTNSSISYSVDKVVPDACRFAYVIDGAKARSIMTTVEIATDTPTVVGPSVTINDGSETVDFTIKNGVIPTVSLTAAAQNIENVTYNWSVESGTSVTVDTNNHTATAALTLATDSAGKPIVGDTTIKVIADNSVAPLADPKPSDTIIVHVENVEETSLSWTGNQTWIKSGYTISNVNDLGTFEVTLSDSSKAPVTDVKLFVNDVEKTLPYTITDEDNKFTVKYNALEATNDIFVAKSVMTVSEAIKLSKLIGTTEKTGFKVSGIISQIASNKVSELTDAVTNETIIVYTARNHITTGDEPSLNANATMECSLLMYKNKPEIKNYTNLSVEKAKPSSVSIEGLPKDNKVYLDGGPKKINLTAKVIPTNASQNVTWTLNGTNNTSGTFNFNKAGNYEITATAEGNVSTSVTINVFELTAIKLVENDLTSLPKEYYVTQKFDDNYLTYVSVQGTYTCTNQPDETKDITNKYDASSFNVATSALLDANGNFNTPTEKAGVTVTLNDGKSNPSIELSYSFKVIDLVIESISVDVSNAKTVYFFNEPFDPSNVIVNAKTQIGYIQITSGYTFYADDIKIDLNNFKFNWLSNEVDISVVLDDDPNIGDIYAVSVVIDKKPVTSVIGTYDFTIYNKDNVANPDIQSAYVGTANAVNSSSKVQCYGDAGYLRIGANGKQGSATFSFPETMSAVKIIISAGTYKAEAAKIDVNSLNQTEITSSEPINLEFNLTNVKEFTVNSNSRLAVYSITIESLVDEFVTNIIYEFAQIYLHMFDYFDDLGYCSDSTHHYYADAKTGAIDLLTSEQRLLLAQEDAFAEYWARFNAWALANNEKIIVNQDGTYTFKKLDAPLLARFNSEGSDALLFATAGLVGASLIALACAVSIKKRKGSSN